MNAHIQNGEFNPGSDFVDVAGTFNDWNGSEALTDDDGDGIYTITLDNLMVAEKIEFKYRINANWDTSEFPFGGPNRVYTVRYWNVLDHVYNDGVTTSTGIIQVLDLVEVYPNPNSGQFSVRIKRSEAADVNLKLFNLQGSTVYSKQLSGIVDHRETIEVDLEQGLYFLTIESTNGIKTEKIIVK
jgi:hypothetical protein